MAEAGCTRQEAPVDLEALEAVAESEVADCNLPAGQAAAVAAWEAVGWAAEGCFLQAERVGAVAQAKEVEEKTHQAASVAREADSVEALEAVSTLPGGQVAAAAGLEAAGLEAVASSLRVALVATEAATAAKGSREAAEEPGEE